MSEPNLRLYGYELLEVVKRLKPTKSSWQYLREFNRDILQARGTLESEPNLEFHVWFTRDEKLFRRDSYNLVVHVNRTCPRVTPSFVIGEARGYTSKDFRDLYCYLESQAVNDRIFGEAREKINGRFREIK